MNKTEQHGTNQQGDIVMMKCPPSKTKAKAIDSTPYIIMTLFSGIIAALAVLSVF